jgi:hypothetical protein
VSGVQLRTDRRDKTLLKVFGKDSGDDRIRRVPDFLEPSREPVLLLLVRIYPPHSPAHDSPYEFMRRKETLLSSPTPSLSICPTSGFTTGDMDLY